MGRGNVGIALLAPALLLTGFAPDSENAAASQDRPTYRLVTESEIVEGIRPTARTTYAYYWEFKGQERELWRVSLNEEYIKHWIDRDGNVWVVSAETDRRNVRPGTFGNDIEIQPTRFWMRDTGARELGFLNLEQAQVFSPRANDPQQPWGQPDLYASRLDQISVFKTRLVLPYSNGMELHVNRIFDNSHGYRCLATWTMSGEQNLLEKIIDSDSPIDTINPVPNRKDIEFWSSSPGGANGVLVTYWKPLNTGMEPIRIVQSLSGPMSVPSHVAVTPNHKILWFDFGGLSHNIAHLNVLDFSARLVGRIDFVTNGMFDSAYRAERELDYTRLSIKRGSQWPDIGRTNPRSFDQAEVIGFRDSKHRWYELTIQPHSDKDGKVTIERALVSTTHLKKEPDYIGFQRTDERIWRSKDGTFAYRVRRFRNEAGRELSQQTLIRHLRNGLEHEFWSKNLYAEVVDAYVTSEGRAYVILSGEIKNANTNVMEEFVHLAIWSHLGEGLAIDLTDKRFFGTISAARSARLADFDVKQEGDARREEFEGDDLIIHPVELCTWSVSKGVIVRFSVKSIGRMSFPSVTIES